MNEPVLFRLPFWGALIALSLSLALFAPSPLPGATDVAWACDHIHVKPERASVRVARRATICLINSARHRNGRPRINNQSEVGLASRRHTDYMRSHHCFSHQCYGEASLLGRVSNAGYTGGARSYRCGEVLAWGSHRGGTPKATVRKWLHSSSHRPIILSGDFEHIGVGVVWASPYDSKAAAGTYTADVCERSG
jgi:uncharacterized protein YkwD